MNAGARTLKRRSDVSLDAIGTAVKISRTSAARHRSGKKKPGPLTRKRYEAAFGIDPRAWDRELIRRDRAATNPAANDGAPPAPPESTSTDRDPVRRRGGEAEQRLRAQLARLDAMRARNPPASALLGIERIDLRLTGELARISGEAGALTEAKMIATPQFRCVVDAMMATLKPWPDAMRALYDMLRKLSR